MSKLKLLLFLLVLAVPAFYYAWHAMPPVQYAEEGTSSSKKLADRSNRPVKREGRLDFSGGKQNRYRKPMRNLFGPLFPPPPPPPKVNVVAPPVQPVAPVVVVQAPPPVVRPVPIPTTSVPMPAFKVLGFLEKKAQLTAFISFQDEIHLLKQGDVFADEFKVIELNAQTITLGRLSGIGQISLPLVENSGTSGFSIPSNATSSRSALPTRTPVRIFRPDNRTRTPSTGSGSRPPMPVVHPPVNGTN